MYIMPLVAMIMGAAAGQALFAGDLAAIMGGIAGFTAGLVLARWYELLTIDARSAQPRLLGLAKG